MSVLSARCYVTHWAVENLSALQGIVWNLKQRRIKSRNEVKCYFLLMDDVTSMSLVGSRMALALSLTHSLTHSILINLFIKLELNNFPLPPLLSIVFVQGYLVVLRKFFDEGRGGKAYIFARKMESLGKSLSSASKIEDRHFDFMCFSFVNMLCFDYRPLLTRR